MSAEPHSAWVTYRRLLSFARPYRGLLSLAVVAALIEAGVSGAFAKMMGYITNTTFVERDLDKVWILPAVIIGLFLVRGAAGYVTDMSMGRAARSIARDLRVKVLGKYLRMPGARFDSEPVPSMLVRLGSDSDQVAQAAVDAMKVMIQQALQAIAMLAVMLWTSWQVTISILILAPPLAWIMDKVA